jgi:hypothetical protein
MIRQRLLLFIGAASLFLLSACSGDGAGNQPQPAPSNPSRADAKQASIIIEGKQKPTTLRLFDSTKTTVPLKFTTYVPDDMISEIKSEREGDSVRFIANLGGPDAYLLFFVEVQGTTEAEARSVARMAAVARGLVERPPDAPRQFDWALSEYTFKGGGPKGKRFVGTIIFSRHADRYFTFVLSHPEKDTSQIRPRAETILENWRWEDNGQPL